nr:MAG: putative capsid protein [Arizlama virus]
MALKNKSRRPRKTKTTVSRAVKAYVRRVTPKPEMKRQVTTIDELAVNPLTSSLNVAEISNIAQGSGMPNRNGNNVLAKGIHVKGVLHNNSATRAVWARLLVVGVAGDCDLSTTTEFWDYQASGIPGDFTTITGLNMMYTKINKARINVKYDKMIKMGTTAALDGTNTKFFNKFIRLNHKITYDGNTYGFANQNYRYAVILLVAEAGDDTVGTDPVEYNMFSTLYFTDS